MNTYANPCLIPIWVGLFHRTVHLLGVKGSTYSHETLALLPYGVEETSRLAPTVKFVPRSGARLNRLRLLTNAGLKARGNNSNLQRLSHAQ